MADKTEDTELDALFRTHYDRVARVIGRIIHDRARAEELAVDVFIKWWRNPSAHGAGAEGWLYRTAARHALDEWRGAARRDRLGRMFAYFRTTQPPATPEGVYAAGAEQLQVRTALAALGRRQVELLLLRSEGLSYHQIAAALGMNPNSVGTLLSRSEDAFRKEFVKRYGK